MSVKSTAVTSGVRPVHEPSDFQYELADLQEQALRVVAVFAGTIGYCWLLWVLWPNTGGDSPPLTAWAGSGLLVLSAVLSYVLRGRFLQAASVILVGGVLIAIGCSMRAFQSSDLAYFVTLPVVFSGVLLGARSVFAVAALGGLLALSINPVHPGASLFPMHVSSPIGVIALVAVASWLSAHSLRTALAWVWHGYERARYNEEVARERAGELRRALKALDEATHRLERTNYMLALARDQAEEARRLKQQFAQTISHELRTPINLVVGFTELMTESPEYYGSQLPPAYRRDLNIVHRNACHLENLVSDVLDLARIEAAQMSMLPEKIDPAALVQEAVSTARGLIEAHGLTLCIEAEADLPQLWVDPTRIRQVLFNLLNNAARFTDEGSISVSVRQRGENVVFAIADTGVGIAPENISRVFDEFEQADGGTRRRHGGAGLGLAISKRFVELHGGRIWAKSQVGQGSTFYFSLPVGQEDLTVISRRLAGVASTATPKGSEEPVLLAIARSPAAAALLTRYVRGCRTVVVPDIELARHTAKRLMPQAVIIDRACAELDSDCLERLAQEWGMPHLPFIACPLPGEELLRRRLAVEGYLIKPVMRRALWDMLRQFGEDVDQVLVIDDDQDFTLLMSRMLEDSPVRRYRVLSAYGGQEGLEMMRKHRPDLVLLDLGLPDIHGFQVVEHIRSDPTGKHTPIVIVSAWDELDSHKALMGSMTIAKADGLSPGEVVRWVQGVVNTTVTSLPVHPVPKEAPVL